MPNDASPCVDFMFLGGWVGGCLEEHRTWSLETWVLQGGIGQSSQT